MNVVIIILQVVLGLAFLMAGGMKLIGAKQSLRQRDHLRVMPWFWRVTGVLEVLSAIGLFVGLWVPVVAVVASLLLAATMIGAFSTHMLRRDPFANASVSLVLLVLVLIVIVVHWSTLTTVFS